MTRAERNSWKTAIVRTKLSAPVRYLREHRLIKGYVLDYGCGRGFDAIYLGWDKYDPHYYPDELDKMYDTVVCSYVLNTLPKSREQDVLDKVHNCLYLNGHAYITVRRNVKKPGYTKLGTYQRDVRLDLPVVTENADFCIYDMAR